MTTGSIQLRLLTTVIGLLHCGVDNMADTGTYRPTDGSQICFAKRAHTDSSVQPYAWSCKPEVLTTELPSC